MELKLYVGNLAYTVTEDQLRTLFAQAGTVTDVALIKDRDTGQSKGFGFVTMGTQAEAENAIKLLNGKSIGNREIRVNVARPPEDRRSGGGGGGGGYGDRRGGGGYGGGGGAGRDRRGGPGGGGTRRY